MKRRGLSESLEDFAARGGFPTLDAARPAWRLEGLRLLHVAPGDVRAGLCAIAPGVAVETTPTAWGEVIES